MEALARLAVRRPIAVIVASLTVAWLGWLAWTQLPVDLLPDIESPTVLVSVGSGDRPPIEMERLYGEQLEQRLFTVRGVHEINQVARTGRLIASVVFDWGSDMDLALVEVQKAVSPVAADPEVEEVLVRRFDPRQAPIIGLGLYAPSGRPDLAELRRIARRQLAPALEQLPGVAQARVLGGREKEVRVEVDPLRLEAHGLTLADLEVRLRAANVDLDIGTLVEDRKVFLVRGLSRFRELEDVEAVVLRYRSAGGENPGQRLPVRVRDVAEVVLADRQIDHLVRLDGEEGVEISIYKEAGTNTVAVSQTVRAALAGLEADLPSVQVRVVSDAASLVEEALDEVESSALWGIGLAVLMLAIFLRSPASTLIVASVVPVSLLATLFLMRFADQGLNLMTLTGLALGAGLLVDNAIVVVDNIHRRLAIDPDLETALARGTGEVGGAILASTLTTCVIFLPVLFVRGLAARLIGGLSFTVVASLLISLVVAVLLVPALASWLLARRPGDPPRVARELQLTRLSEQLARLVRRLLRRSGTVITVSIALTALAGMLLLQLGTELLPATDPKQFSVRLSGPAGQRVEVTARTVAVVEKVLREASGDDLESVLSEVGRLPEDDGLLSAELTEENTARVLVRLGPGDLRGRAVAALAAPALESLAGTQVDWELGSSTLAQAIGISGAPVMIELSGRSLDDLRRSTVAVRDQLAAEPALWNVRSSFEGGPPELRVVIDRALADGLGVDLETVSRVLESALGGRPVTTLTTGDEERPVVLRLPTRRSEELPSIAFTTAQGVRLSVGDIARLVPEEGAREIFRRDQRRVALVTARIADGYDYPQALAAARAGLQRAALAPGLHGRLAGEEEERERTFAELRWALVFSLVLVFMVLAGTFESLIHPFTVLASAPLALIGVAATLVPMGQPIGVMALLGAVVLAGVAVNDAILLIAAARRLMADGLGTADALAQAVILRLRPILMTTLTTILALLPLVFGSGDAAMLRRPFALAVIGGLIASAVTSVLVIPCLYQLLDTLRRKRRA